MLGSVTLSLMSRTKLPLIFMRKGEASCKTIVLCAALLHPWPGQSVAVWCLVTRSIIRLLGGVPIQGFFTRQRGFRQHRCGESTLVFQGTGEAEVNTGTAADRMGVCPSLVIPRKGPEPPFPTSLLLCCWIPYLSLHLAGCSSPVWNKLH